MLNKRFKIAKCKTSLKLATSRIKLMRNKKGVQINQMKKELAQLLESGDDRTARIRVEHVIREEKMVSAYDLIEIYCELIVARLPVIESQKNCPIDLKEAVSSVIFAAPRCSDIPELVDAQKNFTAKYGKEFVSAAIEVRPDCGVNRMLIEKLSAVASDVQTKIKVLTAIAKEYNINWDPTIFEDNVTMPPDDLLNGPTHFVQTSTINPDSPKIQSSNFHNNVQNPNISNDFSQQNRRFTLDAQNVTNADAGSIHTSSATTTRDDMRPLGIASGMMNTSHSFHSNNSGSSSFKDNWNMEFKDATHAAQAAAESAERASFAARAAAQLSSQEKFTRQYSNEARESYTKHESLQVSPTSEFPDQRQFKDSYSTSFNDRKPKIQNTQTGSSEYDISPNAPEYAYTKRSSSLRSRNESVNESSARFRTGGNQSSPKSEKFDNFTEEVIKKQPNITSSRSHSSTIAAEHEVLNSGKKYVIQQVDETDSDDDNDHVFDSGFGYDEEEVAKSFFPSPGRETIRPDENQQIWSPRKNTKNVGSPKSVDHSVKSHLSDGPDSESESETSFGGTKHDTFSTKVNSTKSRVELYDLVEDTGKDLNFGTLAGGLRNKGGFKYPPYEKSENDRPVKVEPVEPTPKQSSFNLTASRPQNKKPSVSISSSDSDSDYHSNKKFPVKSPKTRSSFAPPSTYFTNNETDSEEEMAPVPKRTSSSGVSLRTKGKTVVSKQSPPEQRPHTPRFNQEPSRTMPEPKVSEPPTTPSKKIAESRKGEAAKTPHLSPQTSLEGKKPSHVHPNLPEYDSLAARIQSLQANRR